MRSDYRIPGGYGNYGGRPENANDASRDRRRRSARDAGWAEAQAPADEPLERMPPASSAAASDLGPAPSEAQQGLVSSPNPFVEPRPPASAGGSRRAGGSVMPVARASAPVQRFTGVRRGVAVPHHQALSPLLQEPPPAQTQGYTPMLDGSYGSESGSGRSASKASPLERSSVNPFSNPFGQQEATRQRLLQAQGAGSALGSGGGLNGARGNGQGYGAAGDPGVPRISSGSGDGGGGGGGGGPEVDESGHSIYYKHGVRLVETAEIRLEALSMPATWLVFLLPYLCLAAALWVDSTAVSTSTRALAAADGGCGGSSGGACVWTVEDAPQLNSFLKLSAVFSAQPGVTTYPKSSDKRFLYYTLGVALDVRGRAADGKWAPLHRSGAADNRHTVRCAASEEYAGLIDGSLTGGGTDGDAAGSSIGKSGKSPTGSCDGGSGCNVTTAGGSGNSGDNTRPCEPLTLMHVRFDLPGMLGWYSEYRVATNVTVLADAGGDDGSPPAAGEGAGTLLATSALKLQSESVLYARALYATRCLLVALTTAVLIGWLATACRERKGFLGGSAERQWLTLMQVALLLWQDPVLAVLGRLSEVRDRQLLVSDLLQSVGAQLLLLTWVCLMDGQHFVRRRRAAAPLGSASFEGPCPGAGNGNGRRVSLDGGGGSEDAAGAPEGGAAAAAGAGAAGGAFGEHYAYARMRDDVYQHNFSSDYFLDFVSWKAFYALVALAVAAAIDALRHPEVTAPPAYSEQTLQRAYTGLSLTAGALLVGWVVWFGRATARARRVLRGHPFMATRRQQLTWRVMFVQGVLVSTLLIVALAGQLYRLSRFLGSHAAADLMRLTWLEAATGEAAAFAAWGRGFRTPLGELVFMSVICYTLTFLFLPPPHSARRRHDRMYVAMEHDLPPPAVVRRLRRQRYGSGRELEQPIFCLERACWLCEVSWQSYYDAKKLNLDSFIAPGRMDLSALGLELVADIDGGDSHETRAMLCRGADRLVLAFRGTANVNNVMLDFKVKQVALPNLKPARRIVVGGGGEGSGSGIDDIDRTRWGRRTSGAGASGGGGDGGARWSSGSGIGADEWYDDPSGVGGGSFGGGSSGRRSPATAPGLDGEGGANDCRFEQPRPRSCLGAFDACVRAAVSAVPVAAQTLPRVHQGFWEAYATMRQRVLQAVAAEMEREYRPLFVTGHSLGGALASLAAYDVQSNFDLPDDVVCYTFGSPHVGNYIFTRRLRARVPHHFRVVNDGDFVTGIPQFLGIYRPGGIKVLIDSDCYGTFIVSPSVVENMFGSKATVGAPVVHLLARYRESLEACMEPSDLSEYMAKGFALAQGIGAKADLDNVPDWLKEQRRRPAGSDDDDL